MGDFKFSFADFEVNAPSMFRELWREKDFTNVTLVANDDTQFTAHKIILSASSPLLRRILTNNPHQNPLIYLSNISSAELEFVIKFVYLGTCQVPQAGLVPFLAAGKALEVRGLADDLSPKLDERPVEKSENNLTADIDAGSSVTSPSETEEKEAEDPIHVNTEIKKETLREHFSENPIYTKSTELFNGSDYSTRAVKDMTGRIVSTQYKDEEYKRNEDGQFECKSCEYKNVKQGHLINHIMAVHEKRKLFCQFCDFQSGYKNALQSHIQVVHEGIRFTCKECDYSASNRPSLSQHMRSVHKLFRRKTEECKRQSQ